MTNDPAILFVKPKAISVKDKKTLQAAGVIVVEVDDVANVKFVRAHAELSGTDMFLAAMTAIKTASKSSGVAAEAFTNAIVAALEAQRT